MKKAHEKKIQVKENQFQLDTQKKQLEIDKIFF